MTALGIVVIDGGTCLAELKNRAAHMISPILKRAIFIAVLTSVFYAISSFGFAEERLHFGKFGSISLHRQTPSPSSVVIFIATRNPGHETVIERLLKDDALVIAVDATHYLEILQKTREQCAYPAADFEALSKYVQKKLSFPHYISPVLLGGSGGATLAYATLAQAPPNTFAGAITIGSSHEFTVPRSFCKGYGLNQNAPWISLQPQMNDEVQLHEAFLRLTHQSQSAEKKERELRPVEVKDLPLVEVEAHGDASEDSLALILTGDGGWASIDRDIGNALSQRGISVIGFNSLQYFWTRHSPEDTARDVQRVLQHYLSIWHKQKAMLIGYSFGADVLPFVFNRLSPDLQKRISVSALLGPSHTADFEFHLTDWIGGVTHQNDRAVLPEINKMKGNKLLCLYGEEETDSVCKSLRDAQFHSLPIPGGHHFGGAFRSLADLILKQ